MASKYHHHSSTTSTYNSSNDRKLDELLEDLQNARSPLNGTATGYREIYKTHSSQFNGQPSQSSSEYKIEYLNNPHENNVVNRDKNIIVTSSTIRDNPKTITTYEQDPHRIINNSPGTYEVKYKAYSTTQKSNTSTPTPIIERKIANHETSSISQTSESRSDYRSNIDELDSILGDLNAQAQHTSTTNNQAFTNITSHTPVQTNSYHYDNRINTIPSNAQHILRTEQTKTYQEKSMMEGNSSPIRNTNVTTEVYYNGQPVERTVDKLMTSTIENGHASTQVNMIPIPPTKDLVFTGPSLSNRHGTPSSTRDYREMYHYETKTSTNKHTPEVPVRTHYVGNSNSIDHCNSAINSNNVSVVNRQNYTSYERTRSPSPGNSTYNGSVKDSTSFRSPSPPLSYSTTQIISPSGSTTTYLSNHHIIQETSQRPSPTGSHIPPSSYRSASPTFSSPPRSPMEVPSGPTNGGTISSTTRSSYKYNYEQHSMPSHSPQLQRYSPPNQIQTPNGRGPTPIIDSHSVRHSPSGNGTTITHNYQYKIENVSDSNRYYPPDPNPSSVHGSNPYIRSPSMETVKEQRPPKQINELMETFNSSDNTQCRESNNRYTSSSTINTIHNNRSTNVYDSKYVTKSPSSIRPYTPTRNADISNEKPNGKPHEVIGPPVFYPDGPLFTKKEECTVMSESARQKGGTKAKQSAKYEYQAASRYNEESEMKKTVVPVCLPCCCGLPCIMDHMSSEADLRKITLHANLI